MMILEEIGVDWRDRRLIAELFKEQTAVVRINSEVTEPCLIAKGVRQGCLISPVLYNIYAKAMIKEVMHSLEEGIKVGRVLIKAVRFADDQAMVTGIEKGLQSIMEETNRVVKSYGMKINSQKTKTLKFGSKPGIDNMIFDGVALELLKDLGSYLSENGYTKKDTRVRIGIAKNVFTHLKPIFTGGLRQTTKKKLVWSVATYAAETWAINKVDKKRLEAIEMRVWRKMEKKQVDRQADQ